MTNQEQELARIANQIRYLALESIFHAGSGHPGGSLSSADLISVLYFDEMKLESSDPHKRLRDRFVFSKGHACPAMYAALALRGFFELDQLKTLRKVDSFLQGHPDMKHTPGVDMSTGSLGQGVSAACGIALAAKLKHEDYRVYSIVGDGEIDEGQFWEAMMFAAHYKLDNLVVMLDLNGLQIDGTNDEVMSHHHLKERFEAFGLNTLEIDGHDIGQIREAFAKAREVKGQPTFIIAHTVKGKGVSFMENQVGWHGRAPSEADLEKAKKELNV